MESSLTKDLAPARSSVRRTRRILDLLQEHSWLLPDRGWLQVMSRRGDALHMASTRHLLRPESSWGVDPSFDYVQSAQDHYPRLAQWIQSDSASIPLESNAAGLVMLLEYVPRLEEGACKPVCRKIFS